MSELLREIGQVIRYAFQRKPKFFEIVKVTDRGLLLVDGSKAALKDTEEV